MTTLFIPCTYHVRASGKLCLLALPFRVLFPQIPAHVELTVILPSRRGGWSGSLPRGPLLLLLLLVALDTTHRFFPCSPRGEFAFPESSLLFLSPPTRSVCAVTPSVLAPGPYNLVARSPALVGT
jgi:hypothetical protein